MTSLLDEVTENENLPGVINYIYTEQGRITMPVAMALKAKILVYAASPMFNGNTDFSELVDSDGNNLFNQNYDPNKWVLAKEALFQLLKMQSSMDTNFNFNKQIPIRGFK